MMLECSSVSHLLEGSLPHPTAGTVLTAQPCLPWTPQCTLSGPSLPAGRSGRLPRCPPFPPANGKALGGRQTLCCRPVSGLTVWLAPMAQRHRAGPPKGMGSPAQPKGLAEGEGALTGGCPVAGRDGALARGGERPTAIYGTGQAVGKRGHLDELLRRCSVHLLTAHSLQGK